MPRGRTGKPPATLERTTAQPTEAGALRTEIRNALMTILRSPTAPAMAVASAGRTLIELLREDEAIGGDGAKPAAEMSEAAIDEELARLGGS